MSDRFNTTGMKGSLKVGKGPMSALFYGIAVLGTIFAFNFVGKDKNSSFIAQETSYLTPASEFATESGSLAKYDTILIASPFDSGASERGLRSGSGVVRDCQLDIIANPNGASLDCSIVGAPLSGTAGTLMFNNITATGSINNCSSLFTMGPTQYAKCGTLGNADGLEARLRLWMSDSDVEN